MVIADSDEAALAIGRRAYRRWYSNFMHLWWQHNQKPANVVYPPEIDGQMADGRALVGSPDTVLRALRPAVRCRSVSAARESASGQETPVRHSLNSLPS